MVRARVLAFWIPMVTVLFGCAPVTPAGLYQTPIDLVIPSTKPARDFALCALQHFRGSNSIANEGDHYWIMRMGMQETLIARWDFRPAESGGSVAELRAAQVLGPSDTGPVQRCA